jgi:hypothetical protein
MNSYDFSKCTVYINVREQHIPAKGTNYEYISMICMCSLYDPDMNIPPLLQNLSQLYIYLLITGVMASLVDN